MDYKYYCYRHIRLDTNQPFYIGIGTKDAKYSTFKSEYRRAFQKTNRNPIWKNIVAKAGYKVEIIFESNLKEEIKNKEIEFIFLYKRKEENGKLCNFTDGGDGLNRKFCDKGDKDSQSKKVYQFDLDGNFIKEWGSVREIERELGYFNTGISKVCSLNKGSYKNYFWSYSNVLSNNFKRYRKINQIKEGVLIKTWNKISEIEKELGIKSPNIISACKKGFKCKGFNFEYA